MKNQVQLVGRLGANPEVSVTGTGTKKVRFAIAVSETYKSKTGERVTDVQWHPVVVWGKLADRAERMLSKGAQVNLNGKLFKRSYTTKQGVKRSSIEIVARTFILFNKQVQAV